MSRLESKRPSPALAIALIALFVALGGSAYAVKKVGTKEIKANAVTAAKIKKSAITTPKIRNEAVTGAKVDEASLGVVPDAANAASAATAITSQNSVNAVNATNFSRFFTSGLRTASVGEEVAIATVGPFTLAGECVNAGGGTFVANVQLSTSAANSFMSSSQDEFPNGGFDPGDTAAVGDLAIDEAQEWNGSFGLENQWAAASPDGSVVLQGFANNGVHVFGADCAFLVTWTSNA
jgi:hypothetical protein